MESGVKELRDARIVRSHRGIEARCPKHGHLVGVFVAPGVLEIKCGRNEYVRVTLQSVGTRSMRHKQLSR